MSNSNLRRRLKKKLIESGELENRCSICGILSYWNNKELILQLDHINGINDDNRLDNLRLLCPNCHSQTETYAGRNIKKVYTKTLYYCSCGKPKSSAKSSLCLICANKKKALKYSIPWPDEDEFIILYNSTSALSLSKLFGCSDVAVHKHYKYIVNKMVEDKGVEPLQSESSLDSESSVLPITPILN